MKKLLWRPLFAGFLLIAVSPLAAQSLKLESGTLEFLKGEKSLNVEYVYDGLTVGKLAEKDYIEKKVAEYNTKEAGTGDKWLEILARGTHSMALELNRVDLYRRTREFLETSFI